MTDQTSVQKLDAALEDYQQPKEDPKVAEFKTMQDDVARLKAVEQDKKTKAQVESDMTDLIAHCREDVEIPHDDIVIRGLIGAFAETNETVQEAYINRNENPEKYAEVKDWIKAQVKDKLTGDANAKKIVQATLGAAGHSDDEPPIPKRGKTDQEIKEMTPAEFRAWKAAHR